jgi:serine/threonine protein kinase
MTSLPQLCSLLEQLQLATPQQLARAKGQAASDQPAAFLQALARQPAWWYRPELGRRIPAVTKYQLQYLQRPGPLDPDRLRRSLRIKDYLILHRLGQGGMGVVYQGWDLAHERLVAIKRVKTNNPDLIRRFRRERRILEKLKHPNVARLHEAIKFGKSSALVMEYLNRGTLEEELAARHPIPWREVAGWALQALDALACLHRANILHRDIKPSNLMLHAEGDRLVCKLVDLGLGKVLDGSLAGESMAQATQEMQVLGTWKYMAPEQWAGPESTIPASDVYSLGGTLYHLLTNEPPFPGLEVGQLCLAHLQSEPPSVRPHRADVPDDFDQMIQSMMSKDAPRRPNPTQLARWIERVLARSEIVAAAPTRPAATAPGARTRQRGGPTAPSTVSSTGRQAPTQLHPPEERAPSTISARAPAALQPAHAFAPDPEDEGSVLVALGQLIVAGWTWLTGPKRSSIFGSPEEQVLLRWRRLRRRCRAWVVSLAHPLRYPVRFLLVAGLVVLIGLLWWFRR